MVSFTNDVKTLGLGNEAEVLFKDLDQGKPGFWKGDAENGKSLYKLSDHSIELVEKRAKAQHDTNAQFHRWYLRRSEWRAVVSCSDIQEDVK
jgi:hypothetical protein